MKRIKKVGEIVKYLELARQKRMKAQGWYNDAIKQQHLALKQFSEFWESLPEQVKQQEVFIELEEQIDNMCRETENTRNQLLTDIKTHNQLLKYFQIKETLIEAQIQKPLSGVGYSVEKKQTQSFSSVQYPNMTYPPRRSMDSATQRLCQNYNACIENPQRKSEFIQRYIPFRIGVTNVMARYHSLDIEPIFQKANDGDYYAVAVEENTRYAVVPRFDLTFQESIYGPGAMGQVFECPNYDPQLRYRNMKVVKPAFFEPDSEKKRWTLIEKGELDLGQGE